MKLFAQISISASKKVIDEIAIVLSGLPVNVSQIGLKKMVPELDHWHISSPMYRFHWDEEFDEELFDFLSVYGNLERKRILDFEDVSYAFLTVCPVREKEDEEFSCVLSNQTLKKIISLGLSFQLAPASVMPDFCYWHKS